ncbi:MAG TPA: hypothetical protein VN722_08340 [Hanamia sp.]|nr:hypothetical protein [Hanamia sp.]
MNRFNQKIANEIAQKQLDHTIDCVIGATDPDYHLSDDIGEYEQNFEEDLQEKGIHPTPVKIEAINKQYQRLVDKAIKSLKKSQTAD